MTGSIVSFKKVFFVVITIFFVVSVVAVGVSAIDKLVSTKKQVVDGETYTVPVGYDITMDEVLQHQQDRIVYLERELEHLGTMPLPTIKECVSWCELNHPAYFERSLKTVYEGELESLKS